MEIPSFTLDTSFLEEVKIPDTGTIYDLIVIGGGPAAMSSAVYAARKMMTFALITKDFGGQVRETSEIENWLGFQSIKADDLVRMFQEHVKSFDIPVNHDTRVKEIKKDDTMFQVRTDEGQIYISQTVILATGKRHRPLNVPGEKDFVGKGVAYCATCDAPFFKEKKVAVVGGGNSAFTTALDLLRVGAEVTLINFIKGWQGDAALQKKVMNPGTVDFLAYHQVLEILGEERVSGIIIKDRETEEVKTLPVEGIFVEIGLLPNSEIVKGLVDLNDHGEVIIDCSCRTSLEGFFGAGDVTTVPHKQIVIAAGEGAKAALSAYDHLTRTSLI
ncbi:MAG: FAD-dependent oxidoreductase [bacterium]